MLSESCGSSDCSMYGSLVSRMAAAVSESDSFHNKRPIHIYLKFLFFNSCYHFYIQIIFSQILPKDSKMGKRFLKICFGGFFFFFKLLQVLLQRHFHSWSNFGALILGLLIRPTDRTQKHNADLDNQPVVSAFLCRINAPGTSSKLCRGILQAFVFIIFLCNQILSIHFPLPCKKSKALKCRLEPFWILFQHQVVDSLQSSLASSFVAT